MEFLRHVAGSLDDNEELVSDGTTFPTSHDLELGFDDSGVAMVVGIRWTDIALKHNTPLNTLSVRFTSDGDYSEPLVLRIWAQAVDDAPAFSGANGDITSRAKTTAFVDWTPPAWSEGQADEGTTTPNLAALADEVRSRPGWNEDNAIAFIFELSPEDDGTGVIPVRGAYSYDRADFLGDLSLVPSLAANRDHEEASSGGAGTTFSLTANSSFDPDNPVLKDGTALTGDALSAWQGIKWLIEDHQNRRYVEAGGSLDGLCSSDNTYWYSRTLAQIYNDLFIAFRLTGWAAILDEMVRMADLQYDELQVGWRGHDPATACGDGPSPYPCWVWRTSSASAEFGGTDTHQDEARAYLPIVQLAYALDLNRGETSPAGHDYGATADKWKDHIENEFIPKWQGPYSEASWTSCYQGSWHRWFNDGNSGRHRAGADTGDWPLFSRHHTHTNVGMSMLHLFLGKLIGNSECEEAGREGIRLLLEKNAFGYAGAHGQQHANPRSLHFTGHADDASPDNNYHQPITYAGYIIMDLMDAWLSADFADADERFLRGYARTIIEYAIGGGSGEWLGPGDVAGNTTFDGNSGRPLGQNEEGTSLPITGADVSGFDDWRSASNVLSAAYGNLMTWDEGDALETILTDALNSSGTFGTFSQPTTMSYNNGRLLKGVGAKDWEPAEPPATSFSTDGVDKYDLTVNEGFDENNPTLKDGTSISGDMLTYYTALVEWAKAPATSGDFVFCNPANRFAHGDIYQNVRFGMNGWSAATVAFRMTGDPRLADILFDWAAALKGSLTVAWSGYDQSAYESNNNSTCFTGDPWAPYNKKLRTSGSFWGTGTDGHAQNEERYGSLIAEIAWFMHANRGKTTPNGADFATEADFWRGEVEDWIKKWSGYGDVGDCWETNYEGTSYKQSRQRAASGEWPVCCDEGDIHSTFTGFAAHHYFEALRDAGADIPSGAAGQRDQFANDLTSYVFIDCTSTYGDSIVWKRSWKALGDSTDAALGSTYMAYVAWSLMQIWLMGVNRSTFTTDRMQKIARSYADFNKSDGFTEVSIIGDTSKCGLDPDDKGSESPTQNAFKGYVCGLMPWDTPDDKLMTVGTTVQNDVAGGYSGTPDAGLIPAAQFVALALQAVGDT